MGPDDLMGWGCNGMYMGLGCKTLDKEYLMIIRDNFCWFCINSYVVTPHLNCLNETVQMMGHNIWFQ